MMVSGALLVMLLTLTSEALFALAQRRAVSPGLRAAGVAAMEPAPGFGL